MQPVTRFADVNGTRLCYFEWNEAGHEPSILLVHATGFHGRCWDQVVRHLGARHVIAVDMRGHGRSDNEGLFHWDTFGSDITALVSELGVASFVGVGHSMGGHSVTQAAARLPDKFDRLVLVDPVIMSPEIYAHTIVEHSAWLNEEGEHPVARRRNHFDDAEAMFRNFDGRGSYGLWQSEVLRDYCDYGLVPNPEGDGFVLACPPKVEAAVYMGSAGTDIYKLIESIDCPVKILRAKQRDGDRTQMDFSVSPTWPDLVSHFSQGTDVYMPTLTHFIPMQAPALMADHILDQDLKINQVLE